MELLQSQLNQHYDNEEVNANAFELFEFEVASDLIHLTENQRSILEKTLLLAFVFIRV